MRAGVCVHLSVQLKDVWGLVRDRLIVGVSFVCVNKSLVRVTL